MGVRRLERHNELDTHAEIASYAEVIASLSRGTRAKFANAAPKIVPFPYRTPKLEPYATVELDHLGDFSDDKDQIAYILAALNLE